MKVSWINKKTINIENVNNEIKKCIETKHFTNGGVNVINLQKRIKEIFKIDEKKEVLMVCNGAMGINALVGGLNIYFNKKLRWAVQAFTFPCSKQGLLIDSIILDIDENMGPSINELEKRKDDYDGILITNCFGCSSNITFYEDFCLKNNKVLLFDNAAASMTFYKGKNHINYGNGCIVSLHHTKPIGFGEGGFIVFDKEYLQSMKKAICFGYTDIDKHNYDINASNYKMSEIAAIYINEYLNNLDLIYRHHTRIIKYFNKKIIENNLEDVIKLYTNYSEYSMTLLSTIPILCNDFIDLKEFHDYDIEAKKYYYPIDLYCEQSLEIFKKIICLPLNLDINEEIIDYYFFVLTKNLKTNNIINE